MNKPCIAIALSAIALTAHSASTEIHTEDVELFYKIYDAAGGHPTAEQLQRDYLLRSTPRLEDAWPRCLAFASESMSR